MLKEVKGLEYCLEVLRVLSNNPGTHDSSMIYSLINNSGRLQNVSKSYVQKILPRLVKVHLLVSNNDGYKLSRQIDSITADQVLAICDMPEEGSTIYKLCVKLKEGISEVGINQLYDFS